MVDHRLVGQVREELDRIYNANYIPQWRKQGIMNRVGAVLNHGNYKNMTRYQLEEIAKQRGMSNYTHSRKEGIIYALENGLERVPAQYVFPSEKRNVEAERLGRKMLPSEGYGLYASSHRGAQDEGFDQEDQGFGSQAYKTGHFRTGANRYGANRYSSRGAVGWNRYQSR